MALRQMRPTAKPGAGAGLTRDPGEANHMRCLFVIIALLLAGTATAEEPPRPATPAKVTEWRRVDLVSGKADQETVKEGRCPSWGCPSVEPPKPPTLKQRIRRALGVD